MARDGRAGPHTAHSSQNAHTSCESSGRQGSAPRQRGASARHKVSAVDGTSSSRHTSPPARTGCGGSTALWSTVALCVADCMRWTRAWMLLVLLGLATLELALEHLLGHSTRVDAGADIRDFGFDATQGLHDYIAARPLLLTALAAASTATVTSITATAAFYEVLYRRRFGLGLVTYAMLLSRSLVALCTALPRSPQYLYSQLDFPNPMVGRFIFLFSGHASIQALYGHWLWREGRRTAAAAVHVANGVQWVYLLATRGHYTIDLVLGAIIGVVLARYEAPVTRRVVALERRVEAWHHRVTQRYGHR